MQELIKNNEDSNEQFSMINRAEIDMQISTAKAYPRNLEQCVGEAMSIVMSDKDTAESCFYCLPRAGKEIKGPSVRLAEIIAYAWGNLHAATRIVGNDGRFITAEAAAWDLQKNVRISAEIKRSIRNSKGVQYNADMQQTTGNAACSLALRNAIFRVIPKHIINKLYEQAISTAIGDIKSLPQLRQKGFAWFQKLGINAEKILAYFGVDSIDKINMDNVESMIGIKNAISEKMITVENAFKKDELSDESSNSSELNNSLDEWKKDYDGKTGEVKN